MPGSIAVARAVGGASLDAPKQVLAIQREMIEKIIDAVAGPLGPTAAPLHLSPRDARALELFSAAARLLFTTAAGLLPRYAAFQFHLGIAQDQAGDYPAAIQAFERAVDLDPTYVEAMNNLGNLYQKQGDQGRAREWLELARKLQGK